MRSSTEGRGRERTARPRGRSLLALARPHHWVKNLLLFAPLAAAHQWSDLALLSKAVPGFVAFCLAASSAYVVNDLRDLDADRAHETKRLRPFAAGLVPASWGPALAAGLLVPAALIAAGLPAGFGAALAGYCVLTLAYSLHLKKLLLVDVFCLAAFYTLRVAAGHAVLELPLSPWLISFSMFFFLSLALLKRFAELRGRPGGQAAAEARGYGPADLVPLMSLGLTSGYISALVFALYANSGTVKSLYARPGLLWLICPLLLYWLSRIWFLARRGEVDADPVLFAVRDKASLAVGALIAAILFFASR